MFNKSTKHKDGFAYWCKKCNAEYCRKNYDKDYNLNHKLLKAYNITLSEKKAAFHRQEKKCAICSTGFEDLSSACVDHDHGTGVVRGLLCNNCNYGLGQFKDTPEFLRRAAIYLEASKQLRVAG